jgi:hypothetical protein
VQDHPNVGSWNSALTVVRAVASYANQENLDLMRLMARTGAMKDRSDYIEYIQNADPRRLPGETLKIAEAGVASGALKSNDGFVADVLTQARARVAADRASLPNLERDARAGSASGATVIGAADAFLSYDQPAKAEELYKIALTKAGVDTARALTRLGIAQLDQGKYAEAQATFARVEGPRKPLAQMWAAFAAQKGRGGA